jgi:glycosyltransferase involved in cell wall biosynthesis
MPALRVAVVHYHFRPGGVTSVVQNALRALEGDDVQSVLIAGEPSEVFENCRIVEGLGYAAGGAEPSITKRLVETATAALGGEPDLWHIHNHSLGKNLALPQAVQGLATEGRKLLLQIHDFAEDGRPGNYRLLADGLPDTGLAWPIAPHIHYAALNPRDSAFLADAGVPADGLHSLPNAVDIAGLDDPLPQPDRAEYSHLYITRAIRRKNLGELLLWAAMAEGGGRFGVSRAPQNPEAAPIYNGWVDLARSLALPVEFEAGRNVSSLAELMAKSASLITTSVAEGFGLAFLEPWLAGRGLVGRVLPEIVQGMTAAGVNLDGLYEDVRVPLDWVGERDLTQRLRSAVEHTITAYGRACDDTVVEEVLASMIRDGRVDFGRLDEPLQERVIRIVADSPDCRAEIRPASLAKGGNTPGLIEQNRAVILAEFGLEQYGKKLMDIYHTVAGSSPGSVEALSPETFLDEFLSPRRFNLLRTS